MAASPSAFALPAGDSSIECLRYGDADSGIVLANLHQDERTSIQAGLAHVEMGPGRFYHFRAGGERTLEFELDGVQARFDPNRIFSNAGIEATLRKFNGDAPSSSVSAVREFAAGFVDLLALPLAELVVALHNTDDDFCIHSYESGSDQARNAARVHVAPNQHRHDFFFVTDPALFESLRERQRNVVLQAKGTLDDDGSLSVLCARRNVPYVNIEACNGALKSQESMLRDLFDVLPSQGIPPTT